MLARHDVDVADRLETALHITEQPVGPFITSGAPLGAHVEHHGNPLGRLRGGGRGDADRQRQNHQVQFHGVSIGQSIVHDC